METNQDYANDAKVTFILEGNKDSIKYGIENPSGKKELYICKGTVELNKKIIIIRPDSPNLVTKERLSDLLKYYNLTKEKDAHSIEVKDAHLFFNKSEEIQRDPHIFDPSAAFLIGYEQQDKRGDERLRKIINESIIKGEGIYKTDFVELAMKNDLIEIEVVGTCPSNKIEKYKKKDQIITLNHAITSISSNKWVDNTKDTFKNTIDEFSYRRPIFLNLRKFGEIEKIILENENYFSLSFA